MGSSAGYSGTPLVQKLGLKRGMRVRLLDPPEHYWKLLGVSPAAIRVELLAEASTEVADFTHLFALDPEALENAFTTARAGMDTQGMVWASWPKRSSGVETKVGRSEVMAVGKTRGLVDVKVCAVDEIWSGLKFVIPVASR